MAGSINDVIDDGRYIGTDLIENLGDAAEVIEELVFIVLETTTDRQRAEALAQYYRCCRGEKPWPVNFEPGGVGGVDLGSEEDE